MASKYKRFFNDVRRTYLAENVRVASSFLSRLVGLLTSPPLQRGEGLLIDPCNSIHMMGMTFPIDAVFFDKNWRVVGLLEGIAPGQMSRFYPGAKCCLELPCGAVADSGTQVGDAFTVSDCAEQTQSAGSQ